MPESAQESLNEDLLPKTIQQRRQLINVVLTELEALLSGETGTLAGKDQEDPPGLNESISNMRLLFIIRLAAA